MKSFFLALPAAIALLAVSPTQEGGQLRMGARLAWDSSRGLDLQVDLSVELKGQPRTRWLEP